MNRRRKTIASPPSDRRWTAALRGVVALAVLALLLIVFAAPASAGTYTVWSCKGPSNETLPATAWTQASTQLPLSSFEFNGTCASGGLSVATKQSSNYETGDSASLIFNAPADTVISDFSVQQQLRVTFQGGGSGTYSSMLRQRDGGVSSAAGCSLSSTNCQVGFPTPTTAVPFLGLPTADSISMEISCNVATCPPGNGDVDVHARMVSSEVDLQDNIAPQVTSTTGSLLSSVAPPGFRDLTVGTVDSGGGVRRVSVAVDGGTPVIHETGGDCQEPYTLRVPCPLNLTSAFVINTTQLSVGAHSATVTVEDAAGESTAYGPYPFSVSEPPPPTPPTPPAPSPPPQPTGSDGLPLTNGSPATERPSLVVTKRRIESRRGGTVHVTGTLHTPSGAPISGALVNATSIDIGDADATEQALVGVRTAADGTFSIPVSAKGAKRIRIGFSPRASAANTAVGVVIVRQALRLSVKRSRSRVRPRGRVTISGQLRGAGSAKKGAVVEIDARVRGKWRAVGVVETNSRGIYKWRYRFVSVRRTTKFKFRAIVRRSKAWPWPSKRGRSVTVRVVR